MPPKPTPPTKGVCACGRGTIAGRDYYAGKAWTCRECWEKVENREWREQLGWDVRNYEAAG